MTSKIKTKRERVKFASDNVAGACLEVLDAIIKANEGDSIPYGNDEWSTDLKSVPFGSASSSLAKGTIIFNFFFL